MTKSSATPVRREPVFFYAEPEAMFRVGPIDVEGAHSTGEMLAGSWARDGSARPSRGALFVLVDDVFVLAALAHRPAGRWGLTTELSLDFGMDPAAGTDSIYAAADFVAADAESGLASGTVRDADGRVLAVGTARVRYTDQLPAALADPGRVVLPHFEREAAGPTGPVEQLLGAIATEEGLELPASAQLSNSMGPVHGGLLACASELLAVTTARRTNTAFVTSSVHIAFVRAASAREPVRFTVEAKYEGRTLRVYEVTSRGPSGKPCTIATVTCQVAG